MLAVRVAWCILLLLCAANASVYVNYKAQCSGKTKCTGTAADPFQTLLQGLNAVRSGGSILVYNGTYSGQGNMNLNISNSDTSITSISGANSTVIDCQGEGFGFDLTSGNFYFTGFTVKNCYRRLTVPGNATNSTSSKEGSYGGGAFSVHNAFSVLKNMNLINNTADGLGGAIYVYSNSLYIFNSTITGNGVTGIGGGVYLSNSYLRLDNGTNLHGNLASPITGGSGGNDMFCLKATVEFMDKISFVKSYKCSGCSMSRGDAQMCHSGNGHNSPLTWLFLLLVILCVVA